MISMCGSSSEELKLKGVATNKISGNKTPMALIVSRKGEKAGRPRRAAVGIYLKSRDAPHYTSCLPSAVPYTRYTAHDNDMDTRLAEISTLPQKDRPTAYQALVADIFARPDSPSIVRDVHALVDAVIQDNVVIGRAILSTLTERLSEGAALNTNTRKEIVEDILATVQSRLVSYEEQVGGWT